MFVDLSVQVDVHFFEGGSGDVFASRLLGVVAVVEEVEEVLHNPDHLFLLKKLKKVYFVLLQ
jgi:hypothetical protein